MSTGKRNKTEMAPSFQKNRKNQDQKNEPFKTGDKAQPTAEQIRIAQIIDTKGEDPTLRDKIKQVMDATRRSEEEVTIALHDCDNDPDAAVDLILDGVQVEWSTSKKKKSKPPAEKTKDPANQNPNVKSTNNLASPAGEGEDWNESDNADENSNLNRVNSTRGKSAPGRSFRGGFSRPFNKRGTGRPNSSRDNFSRSVENNADWSKGNFKPSRGGRNFFKNNKNGPQKDVDSFDNKEISDRLGHNENNQEKHDSGGSDWDSDTSDHNKNNNQNSYDPKPSENKGDNKWQDDNYWGGKSRGRGGGMRSRSFNSFNRGQSEDGMESRGGFQRGRGRGRYPGSRNRPEGRGRWEDSGERGYRGRMSNGPSRGGWRGGRGNRSMNKPPIETWNPPVTKDEEDWDQEEEIFTGVETKVFTPSSAAAPLPAVPTAPTAVVENVKLIQEAPKEERPPLVVTPNEPAPTPTPLPTTGQQFLAQLTANANSVPKSIPQSVFNDVHFNKTEITTSEYGVTPTSFGLNNYSESEANSDNKQQLPRARLPPPSKIPSSAVEMPPEVGSGIALLDVQFGALELEQPVEPAPAAPTPSPPPPAEVPAPPPPVSTADLPVYQRPAIQDLLTKSEPQPSTYYQDSYQPQYPKTTHQSYCSSYSQPSGYNSQQSIYSAGLGSNSLSNPYQTYSGQVSRHSALTSTTNSKELDMPTPSVNISPPSVKPKVVPVPPPGVGPPALVNPQYIMNQPYIQQPFYSLEELQLLQGGRVQHVPTGFYDVSYTNAVSNAAREFETRFQAQDTSTSPAPPNPTPSQNQTLVNPPIPYFYYGGSMIGNYQYGGPIYPIAAGSSTTNQHQTTNSPYGKTTGNYTTGPSYTGGGGSYDSQAAAAGGDYSKGRDPVGVSKVTQGVYQVSQSSATNNLTNIYSKSYDKHGFNCATPPPPPTYTLGSQSSLSGGYSTQQLFYSAVTPPHHQQMHQAIDTSQSRSQLGPAPPSKAQPKPKYPPAPYWHQQN